MTNTYNLTGMTCASCEAKVKAALLKVEGVTNVVVSKNDNSAVVTTDKHIAISELANNLDAKYKITTVANNEMEEQTTNWIETYKPILLIFFYISLVTVMVQFSNSTFNAMQAMQHFMAGFFLVFSFFKLLNLKGFATSYAMYDVVARRISTWGYAYPFIELALGIAYLTSLNPLLTNVVTIIVMSVSIIGVLQSVLQKKKIQCACLGAVFNLPMSTITIIEDALMIAMSGAMLIYLT